MAVELKKEAERKIEAQNQILFEWFVNYLRTLGQAHQLLVWGDREIYMGTQDYFQSGGETKIVDPDEQSVYFYIGKPDTNLPDVSVLNDDAGNNLQDLIGFENFNSGIYMWIRTDTPPKLSLSIGLVVRPEIESYTRDQVWNAPEYSLEDPIAVNIALEGMKGIVETAIPKLSR